MKKIAYLLAYTGSILTLIISILALVVGYSYYLDQPTNISRASSWINLILVILSFLLIILIYKMNFNNKISSIILVIFSLMIFILPGLMEVLLKYYYYPQYAYVTYTNLFKQVLEQGLNFFPILLVIIASILFFINSDSKK